MLVEGVLANQERAKKLYMRAEEDLAAVKKLMRPGQRVETKYGTVVLLDAFADGKLKAFKATGFSRYSLKVVG